jgi:hypothetical protein
LAEIPTGPELQAMLSMLLAFSTSTVPMVSTAIFQTGMKAMLPALEGVKSEDRAEEAYKPDIQHKWEPLLQP